MSTPPTPTQQTPPPIRETVAQRRCLCGRFEGVIQVSAAIIISATLASGLLFWSTRPSKVRKIAQPVAATDTRSSSKAVAFVRPADPNRGKTVFAQTCFACHGPTGAGIPGVGATLRASKFIATRSDDQLLTFVK